MLHPFLVALKERPLLADGAMGTLLYERGASAETCFEQLNLSGETQNLVQQAHIDYINAGAELIETNSFSGNRFRLSNFGLDNKVWEINVWAAKVARNAREVAGQPAFVAGSVGPYGRFLKPIGETSEQQLEDAFREQMEGLLAGGVDLFMIETMSGLEETAIAVRAARKVAKLPVVAQISFSVEGHSLMGNTPEDVTKTLELLGDEAPDVIGINCGAGPGALLDSLVRLTRSVREKFGDRFMFSCLPNAGMPSMVGGRFMYMSRADYCASFVEPYVNAGARLIGGCCGTTPDHIRSMRSALDKFVTTHGAGPVAAGTRPVSNPVQVTLEESVSDDAAARVELPRVKSERRPLASADLPGLASKLSREPGKEFFISVELDPPKGTVAKKIIQAAQKFHEFGADAINVGDSPMARVRMSSMATCHLIRQQVGIETIIHFTTRDRNLMGIQADLLGCQALGITTVLALTGDPPSVGNYAHATAVYDVDSVGLIKIISQLNQGTDIAGNSIGSPTKLSIGCALNPTAENRAQEKERFGKKLEAGAHFVMTQPIYQPSDLTDFLDDFGNCPVPILVGIMPLHSFKHAEYLHNEVPGITIPEPVRRAMEKAGEEGAQVGLQLAEELMTEIRPICSGVYIVPSFGRYDDMCTLVQRMKAAVPSRK
jgi:methionine synthase / methylenetetrahydrofolate reductase(NADPH)